jgi:lysophospholipase L1-like esterase
VRTNNTIVCILCYVGDETNEWHGYPGDLSREVADPYCIGLADAATMLAAAPWHRFAVIGDSLSAGVGDPTPGYAPLGWSTRVSEVLRLVHSDLAYLNTGEIRATTGRTISSQMDRMLDFEPDLVHVPCGVNDLLRRELDFIGIEQTLRKMYAIAASTGAQLTTFTVGSAYLVPAFSDWRERVVRLNGIVRTVAADFDALMIDMWAHPLNSRPDLLSADRLHFATSGQAVMASEYVRALAGGM